MKHAFPEDELRPLTCGPLTRDRDNPAHIELNDALGNYSLTLIDSLSTLAIIASSQDGKKESARAFGEFKSGIEKLVEYYGDGTQSPAGIGKRGRGFDLDSKVQVFETVIRGVGGLLSAHLFAQGDLPILGYQPVVKTKRGKTGIIWRSGFVYDGQLLRLAKDLAERLLPAFETATGLPYPRVNLRTGVPFYANSPYNNDAECGQCPPSQQPGGVEITETCSAGAGSLVLEFTTLSRLTGDSRFEEAAKQAFWAVWTRRSAIGLIGSGIDAETGQWVSPVTGIGAGVDSFFEYALKSYILLSGLPYDETRSGSQSPEAFLEAWQEGHAAIKRHVYRGEMNQHPHYVQVDIYTGALRAFWLDSLSAYYQGVLTLAGELEEAQSTHLLFTAIWTRYSALPERWSTITGNVESGLRWWGGRPEFIESTWYLYQATKDPWYLHVGEMALRDIKRRCWTACGWAGLQDVRTGEKMDRMESFFLGETAKYLFLLFDTEHPLNKLEANWVFTTEGHPLIIPKRFWNSTGLRNRGSSTGALRSAESTTVKSCPIPPRPVPLTFSATAARTDLWNAASLARLHLMPTIESVDSPLVEFSSDHPSITLSDIRSPTNYSHYPWTLPLSYIPHNATCRKLASKSTFDLSFPNLPEKLTGLGALQRVFDGILVTSMSGLRLGMVKEMVGSIELPPAGLGDIGELFRIYSVSNVALGRDEKVFVKRSLVHDFNPGDPYFSHIKDVQIADIVVDISNHAAISAQATNLQNDDDDLTANITFAQIIIDGSSKTGEDGESSVLSTLLANIQSMFTEKWATAQQSAQTMPPFSRLLLAATLPTGPGAAPLQGIEDPLPLDDSLDESPLLWKSIFVLDADLCHETLPVNVPREYQILVVRRGGCSFSEKLRNIPSFPPNPRSLQLVIVVSGAETERERLASQADPDKPYRHHPGARLESQSSGHRAEDDNLVQPYLHETQLTPAGLPRPSPIPLVMVGGGDETIDLFRNGANVGLGIANGVGIRRRWFFESLGVKIGNLHIV